MKDWDKTDREAKREGDAIRRANAYRITPPGSGSNSRSKNFADKAPVRKRQKEELPLVDWGNSFKIVRE